MFHKKETNEHLVLVYRIILMMLFYSGMRLLFWWFNKDFFSDITSSQLLTMFRGGLKFDISVILLTNLLYHTLYTLPLPPKWKFSKGYQVALKTVFITVNSLAIAAASVDLIYFGFIQKRTTYNVLKSLQNEDNMGQLWGQFFLDYWYVFLLFVALIALLVYTYSILKPKASHKRPWIYAIQSTLVLALVAGLSIVGIRGGYRHSTRPINMANAGKYVEKPEEMAIVLNTPFSILRNWGKSDYTSYSFFNKEELENIYSPVHYGTKENTGKNVVIFILESWNRELIGALNTNLDKGNYKGYTPFLDSIIGQSLCFTDAYANGQKSIDAMPSIIASIPALVLPYISSECATNRINSLASVLKEEGYTSTFFHGAQNGSMGFQSFANVAGFDHYMGRLEYNNEKDFDGLWGIWDEPYLQYFAEEMNQMQEPFYTTLFTLSSHHPYKVPEAYESVFPIGEIPLHQCVGYTDHALRQFFKKAQTMDWYNNTLFVFTADHSSQTVFPEYKNSRNRFSVPLLFFAPGDSSLIGQDNRLAQQIDIMPTVLNYIGTPQNYVAFGQNLLSKKKDNFVVNYSNDTYQVMQGDKVIYFNGENLLSAYNFKEDATLQHNIANQLTNDSIIPFAKAVVQQYNNRMIENKLTAEKQ